MVPVRRTAARDVGSKHGFDVAGLAQHVGVKVFSNKWAGLEATRAEFHKLPNIRSPAWPRYLSVGHVPAASSKRETMHALLQEFGCKKRSLDIGVGLVAVLGPKCR